MKRVWAFARIDRYVAEDNRVVVNIPGAQWHLEPREAAELSAAIDSALETVNQVVRAITEHQGE